jgi:hypothetical protein
MMVVLRIGQRDEHFDKVSPPANVHIIDALLRRSTPLAEDPSFFVLPILLNVFLDCRQQRIEFIVY